MTGKIVKWTLDANDFENIVDTISLVEDPAIEVSWKAFDKKQKQVNFDNIDADEFMIQHLFAEDQKQDYTFEVDEERFQDLKGQNMIVAPAMIADKLIFRVNDNGDPYYGFFDALAIKNAAYAFQKYKLTDKFNINHDSQQVAEGVYLAETWLVSDTELDKSQYYGYNMPVGSWMTILRIENQDLYDEYVKTGLLTGLSVEAFVLEKIILTNIKNNEN